MSDDPRMGGGVVARHAELIGYVTLMWSDVHAQVGQLFEDFCSSEEAQKRYWETQSDRTQRQLLLSVGSVALQDYPDLRERLEIPRGSGWAPAAGRNLLAEDVGPPDGESFKMRPI